MVPCLHHGPTGYSTKSSVCHIATGFERGSSADMQLIQRLFCRSPDQQDTHEFLLWLINLYTSEAWLSRQFRKRALETFSNTLSITASCIHCQDGSITNTAASVFSVAPASLTMDRTSDPITSDHDCLHCKHTQRIALETYILESPIVCFHYTCFKRRGQTLYKDTANAEPPRTLSGTTTRSYVLRSFITHQGPCMHNTTSPTWILATAGTNATTTTSPSSTTYPTTTPTSRSTSPNDQKPSPLPGALLPLLLLSPPPPMVLTVPCRRRATSRPISPPLSFFHCCNAHILPSFLHE